MFGPEADRLAELYSRTHTGNPGDARFYARCAQGAESVLEVGCGTGRVLTCLATAAERVVGIDPEPAFLRRAEAALDELEDSIRARVRLVQSSMEAFETKERFDLIAIPYNALYCVTDTEDALRVLRRFCGLLRPGGRLIFDVYAIEPEDFGASATMEAADHIARMHLWGQCVDVYERSTWYGPNQRIDATYAHVLTRPNGDREVLEYTIEQRYASEPELRELVAGAGLQITEFRRGFDSGASSSQQVVIATPSGEV